MSAAFHSGGLFATMNVEVCPTPGWNALCPPCHKSYLQEDVGYKSPTDWRRTLNVDRACKSSTIDLTVQDKAVTTRQPLARSKLGSVHLITPFAICRLAPVASPMSFRSNNRNYLRISCAATRTKITMPAHGCDYYELLGVDPQASSMEIKQAYRWLQKRCHPDIAGDVGHDMALLLNEAYSILSDLNTRIMYDQLRITWITDESFSGRPVWSTWHGHPEEEQAVFVDESQCIGCLKCAMIAGETFAIENHFGRARAVKQWANDEVTLQDAIEACPVDCIRWVERSRLAALEHIMSQMPRMAVGLAQHSADGTRQKANVFEAADKFLEKRARAKEASQPMSSATQRSTAAAETIRAKSGRWWRTSFNSHSGPPVWQAAQKSAGALIPLDWVTTPEEAAAIRASRLHRSVASQPSIPEELRTLHEAARQRSGARASVPNGQSMHDENSEEYWTPLERISCAVTFTDRQDKARQPFRRARSIATKEERAPDVNTKSSIDSLLESLTASIPVLAAAAAAVFVGLTAGDSVAQSATDLQAPLPSQFTTGLTAQVVFAAVVWYTIGAIFSGSLALLQVLVSGKITINKKDFSTEESDS